MPFRPYEPCETGVHRCSLSRWEIFFESEPMPTTKTLRDWITAREAARRLKCDPKAILGLADQGYLTVRKAIGKAQARYLAESVDRLARESIVEATASVSVPS